MSRADGVLVVVLKRRPFEDERAGIKLEEYRKDRQTVTTLPDGSKIVNERGKETWAKKLLTANGIQVYRKNPDFLEPHHFQSYHTIRAFFAYEADRPMFERPIRGIRWGVPNPAWTYGIVSPGPCFIIELEPPK